jgi:hypothetical protein
LPPKLERFHAQFVQPAPFKLILEKASVIIVFLESSQWFQVAQHVLLVLLLSSQMFKVQVLVKLVLKAILEMYQD